MKSYLKKIYFKRKNRTAPYQCQSIFFLSSSNGEVNKSIKLTAKTNKIELTIGILELKIPGNSFRRKGKCATDGAVGANLQPPGARPLMLQPASNSLGRADLGASLLSSRTSFLRV